jgi:hypothetical protein
MSHMISRLRMRVRPCFLRPERSVKEGGRSATFLPVSGQDKDPERLLSGASP